MTKNGKRVIVLGATGMVGGIALRYCLARGDVSSVTAIGRRPTGVIDDKLREVAHGDFSDCLPLVDELRGVDAALFCIGAYTGAVPDEEFRKITVDYTVSFAEALHEQSPDATFCFLSGAGADQTEKSRMSFARYKGMAENALLNIGFPRVHIFRPGYIYPVERREEPNLMYRISRGLYPLLRWVMKNGVITSEELARAMVIEGLDDSPGSDGPVLENRAIRELVNR